MSKQAFDFPRVGGRFLADPRELVLIEDPNHHLYSPRIHLPPDEHIVLGMIEHGVELDVLVQSEGGQAVVVDGRRRVVNAREAARRMEADGVPALRIGVKLVRGKSHRMVEKMALTNAHRRENDPVEEARLMARMIEAGRTESEVAAFYGVGTRTVENRLALLDLVPHLQDAVANGAVAATAALAVAGKSEKEQLALLDEKASKPKGAKTAPRKQAKKRVREVLEHTPRKVQVLMDWCDGTADDGALAGVWPALADVLKATRAKAKKDKAK